MDNESKTEVTSKETTKVETSNSEGKNIAIISYITIIGLIIAFVMNNEKKNTFASYHIRQSLGLAISAIALSMIGIIPILGWIISFLGFFFVLFLWIMGLINALNSKEKPLPVLGKKFEEWFKDVK
jgi:uncharacterized membrane protein